MNKTEKAMQMYCDMMIKTIEGLKEGWRQTWLTTSFGRPTNTDGRAYNSMNEFLLLMLTEMRGWKYPVFVTFNRAKQMGASVKKGEKSFPVMFWKLIYKDKDGNIVDDKKDADKCFPMLRVFDVFNVEQTTIPEECPTYMEKLAKRYTEPEMKGEEGMYVNDGLDALIAGAWCCPISCKKQDRAFYSQTSDTITLPTKEQFNKDDAYVGGMEFYATALHEMAHSTGAEKRLNRLAKTTFGSKDYGREELVAELTAAICGHELGFNTAVQTNNAAYLSSWLRTIKQEPKFLVSVLSDVGKAVTMIDEHLQKVVA